MHPFGLIDENWLPEEAGIYQLNLYGIWQDASPNTPTRKFAQEFLESLQDIKEILQEGIDRANTRRYQMSLGL